MSEGCVFCDQSWMRAAEIFIETRRCIFASTRDPDIRAQAGLAEYVLPGSGDMVPIAHRTSVVELTPGVGRRSGAIAPGQDGAARSAGPRRLFAWLEPGRCPDPHMHVIPRFDDEPLSDRWLRSAINVPENRRPDPWAPGERTGTSGCPIVLPGDDPDQRSYDR